MRINYSMTAVKNRLIGLKKVANCRIASYIGSMTYFSKILVPLFLVFIITTASHANKPDVINVGIFFEWPTPNLIGVDVAGYEAQMGVKVKWKAFETSEDMNYAFAEGKLDIAFAHEMVPFMKAVSNGQDLIAVGVAVSYPEHDACVVSENTILDQQNKQDFVGKRLHVKPGSVSDFRMRKMMDSLGVDVGKFKINAKGDGAHIVKAMYEKQADIGCAFGAPVLQMRRYGDLLMDAEQMHKIGLRNFDFVTMSGKFIKKYRQYAEQFMRITETYNEQYRANPGPQKKRIAGSAFLTIMNANRLLKLFQFPSKQEQLSVEWLAENGAVIRYMNELGAFLKQSGQMKKSLPDYSAHLDQSILRAL